ncbi:MAG: ACP phosphodiesterase [Planctomycetota bacterium]|nr:ACP phosphodiesterase [Planctomycetota bacterium]
MNWLAHLRLAPSSPLVRLGNLAGDFVQGVDTAALHPDLQRGIAQHRAVDRFVDAHPAHRRGRTRFAAPWRRFAGVALDVVYDHFLARDWSTLGDGRPLEAFVDDVHDELARHCDLLPPALARASTRMREHRWLSMYASIEGVDQVLQAMARRSTRAQPLASAASELRRLYRAFEADFAELWPELQASTAAP